MVSLLVKMIILDYKNTKDAKVRQAYGMLCGSVGIALNVFLFLGKFLAGFLSGSVAITADAFNNLSDAGSSVITLAGFKMAGKKPDKAHPFGQGRIEYISGFLVSVIILLMAFELLKSAVEKILHPSAVEASPVVYAVLILSVLLKVYMFFYNRSVGKKIDSAAMEATAKDSLSDTTATLAVLISTVISQLTGLQIDGYCGIVVALFVFRAGLEAARDTIEPLLGQPPEPEFVQHIEEIIMRYKEQGVLGIHDLVVHNYGPGRVMLSVHVEVPATDDILVLHDMIDRIEHQLAEELNCSAVIHMDPVCVDDEKTNEMKKKVADIISKMKGTIQFHDFRMVQGPTHTNLIFDVEVPFDYPMSDGEIVAYPEEKIQELDGSYFAVIEVDKLYV